MARHPYTLLDVFTDRPLAGNALAVVHDADGVSDEVMLAFARETRLMETTFVQTAEVDADYRNRIFTVTEEVPFAGHPSLGTAVAVALARGEDEVTYRQQTRAGVQPVTVERRGDRARASVLQEPAVAEEERDPGPVLAALGLAARDAHPDLRPQLVSTGLPAMMVPLRDVGALTRARPDYAALNALHDRPFNCYPFAVDPAAGAARARSFAGLDEGEDPATGSAAGPLLAYLNERLGLERLMVEQGIEMGRPSRLEATMEDGRPRVGGDVVVVITGSVRLP